MYKFLSKLESAEVELASLATQDILRLRGIGEVARLIETTVRWRFPGPMTKAHHAMRAPNHRITAFPGDLRLAQVRNILDGSGDLDDIAVCAELLLGGRSHITGSALRMDEPIVLLISRAVRLPEGVEACGKAPPIAGMNNGFAKNVQFATKSCDRIAEQLGAYFVLKKVPILLAACEVDGLPPPMADVRQLVG